MKKLYSLAAMLCFCTLAAFADRAMPGLWQTKTLADGKEVKVELCGDEFAHFWRTASGVCYTERDGVLYPVTANEIEAKAHSRRAQMGISAGSRRMAARAAGAKTSAYVGSKKGLIILVEFSDKAFSMSNPQQYYERMANEEGFSSGRQQGSVHDYFMEQSGGVFDLSFDVIGPVKMPNGYAYYGADKGDETDVNIDKMLTTAINMADSQVKWSDYDWDGDGEVDQIYFLYAGGGQATGAGSNTIWPHKWNLMWATGTGRPITKQGMILDTYACSNEVFSNNVIAGIGTICHEFSHCLGLPDMYDTTGNSGNTATNYGMGNWDLMNSGNYNNSGYTPAGYTSWEKMMAGWLEPEELTSDKYVTEMLPLSEGGQSYIVYNPANRNEYYMIENRAKSGWDAGLPGEGMLILHVDYDETIFMDYNAPNTFFTDTYFSNDHQRLTIFHADGTEGDNDEVTDPYPYGNLNVLSNYSKPAATLHNANTDGSKNMNIRINRISRAEDGSMSFVFGDLASADASVLFAESFDDCNGSGANDNCWITLYTATGALRTDVDGWSADYAKGGRHCARIGQSKPAAGSNASITSPSIDFKGNCTLTFRAAPFTKEGTMTMNLSADNSAIKFSQNTMSLSEKKWTEFTVDVTGKGAGKLVFSADCRFYLDDIIVRDNTVTGIEDIPVDAIFGNKGTDNMIYDMQGRRVDNANGHGIYIINGKKVVR